MTSLSTFRRALAAASAVALVAVAAPTASAGPLVASADNCATQSLSQVLLPWADVANYTLNPGGSFEHKAAGWSLDGAAVAPGNEPWNVTSADDNSSLAIAPGGSATSAPICVGIEHPDLRFFSTSSNPAAGLKVEVLFETSSGDTQSLTIGGVNGGKWSLSQPIPVVANLLPLLPGEHTAVSFRFSAYGGSFRIDDLYVDPYARN